MAHTIVDKIVSVSQKDSLLMVTLAIEPYKREIEKEKFLPMHFKGRSIKSCIVNTTLTK
jgi:hypothetical protein